MKRICDFIARWMGVLVLLTAIGALLVPEPLASVDMWIINPLLGLIMFGMGLTLNPKDFRIVFSRPKDVLIGCLAQFTVMPFLAWALTKAFALPPDLALGVILVGCCPGGTASNVITYLAKGDLALSVGMTAVSTLLAPYVVIAPIVAGLIIQKLLPTFTQRVVAYLPAFSTLMIAVVVALIVAHSAPRLLTGGLLIILVVMLHNICGLGVGYGIGHLLGLQYPKRVAISIEVGMQNSGLASSLATLHFAAFPMATIPGAIFSVWHNISGALAARLYNRS